MRSHWSNRWAFIMATAGSAVGLGNVWKFPYLAGTNGGSAFVLVYLACVLLIGLPLLMTEIMLGRRAQKNPVDGMAALAREAGASPLWRYLGLMGVVAGVLILGYYSVVAGWVVAYGVRAAYTGFAGLNAQGAAALFETFLSRPGELVLWHTVFMALTMVVVAHGVTSGLERANKVMMPGLVFALLILLGYSLAVGDVGRALAFLFTPDFSRITPRTVLDAMGQAFFSLSIGMGAIMVYGSYLQRHVSIARAAGYVVAADTGIAVLAGITVFALVFAHGGQPASGPGLVFQTLPVAFGQMPGGQLFAVVFFILLLFAAWTSSISLVEPAVAWLTETTRLTRKQAALGVGMLVWLLGVGAALAFNVGKDYRILGFNFFDALDNVTAKIMLPLGGLLMAVFAVWVMHAAHAQEELALKARGYRLWLFTARWIAPAGIILVFLNSLDLLPVARS